MTLLRKASVCILLAALLYGAFAGARPARAATPGQVACVILTFGICVAFQDLPDQNPTTCRLLNVSVGGNATTHAYRYRGRCTVDDGSGILQQFGFQGSGTWDRSSNTAREAFQNLTGSGNQRSVWSCPEDPWISSGVVTCQLQLFTGSGGYQPPPLDSNEPWGALLVQLTPGGPEALRAALAAALQPPSPLPDLMAQLTGPQTANLGQQNLSYTVNIGNRGKQPAKEVILEVSLPKLLNVQTAKGSVPELNCAIQATVVACNGGSLELGAGKQLQVLVTAAAIGLGQANSLQPLIPAIRLRKQTFRITRVPLS